MGFELEFKSYNKCSVQPDDSKKFKLTIKAFCTPKVGGVAPEGKWSTLSSGSDKCETVIRYDGPEACDRYTLEVQRYLKIVRPYLGLIFLLTGLALTFAGRKLVIPAFGFLFFLGSSGLIFMLCYNFLPAGVVSPVLTGFLILFSCALGGFLAYVT